MDTIFLSLVAFSLMAFLILAGHELGHVLAGQMVGFRFLLFVVGPLKFERKEGRIRAGLNKTLALAGGVAASAPTDERNVCKRMAVIMLGGPLASLLLTVM